MTINDITLGEFTATIGLITALGTCLFFLFSIWYRFGKMERQASHRQEDSEIIFKSLRGCLEGLIENGANGSVKKALGELNDYTAKKTAGRQAERR